MHLASPTEDPFANFSAIWTATWGGDSVRFRIVDFEFRKCDGVSAVTTVLPVQMTAGPVETDKNNWPLPEVVVPNAKLVVNFTQVDTKFTDGGNVTVEACDRSRVQAGMAEWDAPAITPNAGDLVVVDGQCVVLTSRLARADGDCRDVHVVTETSLLSDFCDRSPNANVCKSSDSADATAPREPSTTTTAAPPATTAKSHASGRRTPLLATIGLAMMAVMTTAIV